jgi:hypothetical protein
MVMGRFVQINLHFVVGWFLALSLLASAQEVASPGPAATGAIPAPVEVAFRVPSLRSDFWSTEIWVVLRTPSHKTVRLPAFYDGPDEEARQTWKFRYTPLETGRYSFQIIEGPVGAARPAEVEGIGAFEFEATAGSTPGFVRVDPRNPRRFVLGGGEFYFPLGHNVAWGRGNNPKHIPAMFEKMGRAGENWARVWMNHWDYKNLEWVMNKKNTPGKLDLTVARNWDSIVGAAEKNGLRIQMTLQHHGQYSTTVNPNWREHPWNEANGGFLKSPVEFFTHPRARELTRMKYRYIVARWGYSPAVMAWELFNEVQYTDAWIQKKTAEVARWHDEMADYLRSIDVNGHLITTSSLPADDPVYRKMDYYQPHSYPPDLVVAAAALGTPPHRKDKPVFYGEMGPKGNHMADDGRLLQQILWPSLMSEAAGAAQYWAWEVVEKKDLYPLFGAAARFVETSRLAARANRSSVSVPVESTARATLKFGPGGDWGRVRLPEFFVASDGRSIEGLHELTPYLHGDPSKVADGFPKSVTFRIDARAPTTFTAEIGTIARAGARASLLVNGREVKSEEWPAASKDYEANARLVAELPEGRHSVTLRSVGKDWFFVRSFTLTDFAPALAAVATRNRDFAAIWIYHRAGINTRGEPVTGRVRIPDLDSGSYRVVWWDTTLGAPVSEEFVRVDGGTLVLNIPPVASSLAAFAERL